MRRAVTLADIAPENCSNRGIRTAFGVSKTTAWRLLSGRVSHIVPGYHDEDVKISDTGWSAITEDRIRYMRNCVIYQIRKWRYHPDNYADDFTSECVILAYNKSGVWVDMPEQKKRAYLASIARHTVNDCALKTHKEVPSDDPADEQWHDYLTA